jgi:type IV pilus assembly protein PilA
LLASLRDRLDREDRGFTLIELMVVVLIIAILIAIAIPTFLGARRRAQDKQAQSNLRNALTAEKTHFVDTQTYTTDATDLGNIESSLDFLSDNGWVRGVFPEAVDASSSAVMLRSESRSGSVFCIMDLSQEVPLGYEGETQAGTYYATTADGTCAGSSWDPDVAAGW